MSLLSELLAIAEKLKIPSSTAVYSGTPPDEYLVFVPMGENFGFHADNNPEIDIHEVRISLFSKGNYNQTKSKIIRTLISTDITITARKYVGYENDTKYHHYAIDVAKNYEMEEI